MTMKVGRISDLEYEPLYFDMARRGIELYAMGRSQLAAAAAGEIDAGHGGAAAHAHRGVQLVAQHLQHHLGDGAGPPPGDDLDIGREETQHALLSKAALEGAHGIWMGLRFLGALLGRPIGKQHQGSDHLIAPLHLIHEAQVQLGTLRGWFHDHPFHRLCSSGGYVAYGMGAVI